jgi:hypothetical protein
MITNVPGAAGTTAQQRLVYQGQKAVISASPLARVSLANGQTFDTITPAGAADSRTINAALAASTDLPTFCAALAADLNSVGGNTTAYVWTVNGTSDGLVGTAKTPGTSYNVFPTGTALVGGRGSVSASGISSQDVITARVSAADATPVRIITDVDIGQDVDDVGALALLHHLADLGECQIIAMAHTFNEIAGAAGLSALNCFYGRPDIPIGHTGNCASIDYYRTALAAFPNAVGTTPLPSAKNVIRKALAESPDGSVVWYVQGPMTALNAVYNSASDSISPMTGEQLMRAKLRELVVLGGYLPGGGAEFDLTSDPTASQVINQMVGFPITFQSFEVGATVLTISNQPVWSPVKESYRAFFASFGGVSRSSWGAEGLLYCVRGAGTDFTYSAPGTHTVDVAGANTWTPGASGKHRYLVQAATDAAMITKIQTLQDILPALPAIPAKIRTEGVRQFSPLNLDGPAGAQQFNFWKNGVYQGTGGIDGGATIVFGAPAGSLAFRASATIDFGDGSGLPIFSVDGTTRTAVKLANRSGSLGFGPTGTGFSTIRRTYPVLVGGTVTASDTAITANSEINVGVKTPGGTTGTLRVVSKTAGVGYVITSSSGTDTSTLAVTITEP